MKRLTTNEFIEKARNIHGYKYDYSNVVYKGVRDKICIICPVHGVFWQTARNHLSSKGCVKCGYERTLKSKKDKPNIRQRHLKYNVGVNDYSGVIVDNNGKIIRSYQTWVSMLTRCYSEKYQRTQNTYKGCVVCEEWHKFSNFKKWFEQNYQEGYELDKDILIKGNKVYSPSTCCFIPKRINTLLLRTQSKRGSLPIGVTLNKKSGKYIASCSINGVSKYIGSYDTPQMAFDEYKKEKEKIIKEIANEYLKRNLITDRVYNAIMNYQIQIND